MQIKPKINSRWRKAGGILKEKRVWAKKGENRGGVG